MTQNPPFHSPLDRSFGHFEVLRINGTLGGIVQGLTLSPQLSDEVIAALEQALVQYKVLFFRDQSHLDDAQH